VVGARGHGGRVAVVGRTYGESKDEHDKRFFSALYEATGGNVSEIGKRARLNREIVRIYLRMHRIGTYGR
jgi:hypothetical protein